MNIVLYPPSNSACMSFTPDKMWGVGLGGAEQSVVLLSEELVRQGHSFTIYNNIEAGAGEWNGVRYTRKGLFKPEVWQHKPDVFILYRAPDPELTRRIRKCWQDTLIVAWSCDQTTEGDYVRWFDDVDYCVTISPFHTAYHVKQYGAQADKISHIDLPINAPDYADFNGLPRAPRFLWSSQAMRGLDLVSLAWTYILGEFPDAHLDITADHRLWGVDYAGDKQYRPLFAGESSVTYHGAIPRQQLVSLQKQAAIQLSSLTYEELFGVSVAEAQAAGAIPIVSNLGALPTTVMVGQCFPHIGLTQDYFEAWLEAVIATMKRADLPELALSAHKQAMLRFNPTHIAKQWIELLSQL